MSWRIPTGGKGDSSLLSPLCGCYTSLSLRPCIVCTVFLLSRCGGGGVSARSSWVVLQPFVRVSLVKTSPSPFIRRMGWADSEDLVDPDPPLQNSQATTVEGLMWGEGCHSHEIPLSSLQTEKQIPSASVVLCSLQTLLRVEACPHTSFKWTQSHPDTFTHTLTPSA